MGQVASGDWLTRKRVIGGAFASAVLGIGTLLYLLVTANGSVDAFGRALGTDFSVFWNAGNLANLGRPLDAWDVARLNEAARATHGADVPRSAWLYPPVFLFISAPLALLPYVAALLTWQIISLLLAGAVLAAILKDWRAALIALATPLTPLLLAHGQNAYLTAALLGFGLVFLDRRWLLAGLCFGLLVYKPQLALMLAPMLLVGKRWGVIAVSAFVALAVIAASTGIWGWSAWEAFFATAQNGRRYMESGITDFYRSASLFAGARMLGAGTSLAYVVQGLGLLTGLAMIVATRKSSPNLRNAAVCVAAAASTPYLLDYDIALAGLGAVFLFVEGSRRGFLSYEKSLLAFVWIEPWFARPFGHRFDISLGAITILLLVAAVARRAWLEHRHPAIDVQGLAGDVPCLPGGEIDGRGTDIVAAAHRA